MLFACDGRFGKVEIRNGEKEGEYTLTFPFWSDHVSGCRSS